jgi:hypothetical protein
VGLDFVRVFDKWAKKLDEVVGSASSSRDTVCHNTVPRLKDNPGLLLCSNYAVPVRFDRAKPGRFEGCCAGLDYRAVRNSYISLLNLYS